CKRTGERSLRTELGKGVQQCVEQHGVVERVVADQRWRQIARDDPKRGDPALHWRGLADAKRTVIAVNPDPSAALLWLVPGRPADLKCLDVADFHGLLRRLTRPMPSHRAAGRSRRATYRSPHRSG